jgi:hypothetical protein
MKKMVLGLSLALATFGLFLSPALAETNLPQGAPSLNVADQTFLDSLAVQVEPTPAAKQPAFGAKALCTATANCGADGAISCSGNNSTTSCTATDRNCSAGQRGKVTCDGVTTLCPTPCPCSLDCNAARIDCADICSPCPAIFSCSLSTCTTTCRCKFTGCF